MVDNGPSQKAGLQIGDVIKRVNGDESPDAYGLALALVGATEKVTLGVQRGEDPDAELIELEITPHPVAANHSTHPEHQRRNRDQLGRFRLSTIAHGRQGCRRKQLSRTSKDESQETLQAGDTLQEVRLGCR